MKVGELVAKRKFAAALGDRALVAELDHLLAKHGYKEVPEERAMPLEHTENNANRPKGRTRKNLR